jgi:hypothetical protein
VCVCGARELGCRWARVKTRMGACRWAVCVCMCSFMSVRSRLSFCNTHPLIHTRTHTSSPPGLSYPLPPWHTYITHLILPPFLPSVLIHTHSRLDTHTHTHTHTPMYTNTHAYTFTNTLSVTYTNTRTHTPALTHTFFLLAPRFMQGQCIHTHTYTYISTLSNTHTHIYPLSDFT